MNIPAARNKVVLGGIEDIPPKTEVKISGACLGIHFYLAKGNFVVIPLSDTLSIIAVHKGQSTMEDPAQCGEELNNTFVLVVVDG